MLKVSNSTIRSARRRAAGVCAALLATLVVAGSASADGRRFDRLVNVAEINSSFQEKSPCISADGLEILFQSNRDGGDGQTIWFSQRETTDDSFSTPVILLTDAATPELSADALTLYFSRNVNGKLDADIFFTTRPTRDDPFGPATRLDSVCSDFKDAAPSISHDGLTLYFHSDRPGGVGMTDIWVATRNSLVEDFGAPVNLTAVNSPLQDWTPQIGRHDRRLYLSSNRPGADGADIFVATRLDSGLPFQTPELVKGPVNALDNDKACDIAADGLQLYFRSTRQGGIGESDIWLAVDTLTGNVNRRNFFASDVLFVNGSSGGEARIVDVATGDPITVTMNTSPAGPNPGHYALYAFPVRGLAPDMAAQPFNIGFTAFSTPLNRGGGDEPICVGNTFQAPGASRLGIPWFDLDPAPGDILSAPRGYGREATFVLQALLIDDGSVADIPLSMTNVVVVRVNEE